MTQSVPLTAPLTLTGTPVVPGVGYGPLVRPAPRPVAPAAGVGLDDDERAAEVSRFTAAAATVGQRLASRAAAASGAAAEVLQATAALAQDRGLLTAAEQRIASGTPAPQAVTEATEQFAALFTQLGG
ncbi:MAG: phosphoenolpyruvate-utilizing N-terminal domain-containing protein, partial [Actinomycetes bacterium]